MEACLTLDPAILETLNVRISSNIESEEKMAVSQTVGENCQSCLSKKCRFFLYENELLQKMKLK